MNYYYFKSYNAPYNPKNRTGAKVNRIIQEILKTTQSELICKSFMKSFTQRFLLKVVKNGPSAISKLFSTKTTLVYSYMTMSVDDLFCFNFKIGASYCRTI